MTAEFDPSIFQLSDPPPSIYVERDVHGRYVVWRSIQDGEAQAARNWQELEPEVRELVERALGHEADIAVQYACPGHVAARATWPAEPTAPN
jgi:hypothetical protein